MEIKTEKLLGFIFHEKMMQMNPLTYYLDGTELASCPGFWAPKAEEKWLLFGFFSTQMSG